MAVCFGSWTSKACTEMSAHLSCKTRMGRRLMREWIGRPLLDVGYVDRIYAHSLPVLYKLV